MKEKLPLIILLILALATRFIFLAYPAEVVFDEVHFGKFVSAYSTHQYYFDIHPPLGKLMISGLARLNFTPVNFGGFAQIGEAMDAKTLFVLRFLSALFGALLPLIFYGIIRVLGGSKKAAFLAGFLVIFDNAFLIESKFILVDSFLFLFGFLSILVFLISQKQENRLKKHLLYFLAMALAGLAFSIKWTGLAFLGINLFLSFINFLKNINFKRFLKFSVEVVISLFLVAIIYALPFAAHFKLLDQSGPGDAFMSRSFQTTLKGNVFSKEKITTMPFLQKFVELNKMMWSYNSGLAKTHPDASAWTEWPIDKKPVWYWARSTGPSETANIYLWGNPLIWWLSGLAVLLSIFRKLKHKGILLLGYFANLLPFIFVSRIAFLYHYLPALGFAILLLALAGEKLWEKRPWIFYGFLMITLIVFILIVPISYGLVMPAEISNIYQAIIKLFH